MSATPNYVGSARNAEASLTAGNLNRDGTGAIVAVFDAGADGSKISEVVLKSTAQPADSTVVFYLYDVANTTYYVFDEWDLGAPAAGSATVASYRQSRTYQNLVIESGWRLCASVTVTPTSGSIKVHAFGGDF